MSTQFTNRQWRLPNNENKDKQSNYSMDFLTTTRIPNITGLGLGTSVDTFSISLWFNKSNMNYGIVFSAYSGSGAYYQTGVSIELNTDGTIVFFNGATRTTTSSQYSINTWYNLVVTSDGTTVKMYVNGSQVSLDSTTVVARNFTNVWINSAKYSANNFGITGKIDGVSIFNYALTDGTGGTVNQIAALYGSSSTGIGNPMTLNPVAYYPLGDQDAFNGANYLVPNSSLKDYVFDFDGSDKINCGTANTYNEFCLSAWVKKDSTAPNYAGIFGTRNSTAVQFPYLLSLDNTGKVRLIADGTTSVLSDSAINNDTWYHVVGLGDGTNLKLYINGQLQTATATYTTPLQSANNDLMIGGQFDVDSTFLWVGEISNVQIFNTALPATGSNSVETLYNNGSPLTSMSGFTSLQGWWKLDASATYDSSTTTWTIEDSSTNSNTGTSSGMTQANLVQSDLSFTSGYSPFALDFDGTNDYIDAGVTVQQPTTNYSVSCWVKLDSVALCGIVGNFKTGAAPQVGFALTLSSGLNFQFWSDGTASSSAGTVTGTSTPNSSTWYNVIGVYDGSLVKIYVNNVLENSVSYSATPSVTDQNLVIGRWYGNYDGFYTNGSISNVSVWNTALTSAQVTEIYSEGIPQNLNNHSAVSSLVSWWQLGSNSSFNTNWTVLDEVAASGNNGTSVNMDEVDIVDGVNTYGGGTSSGMGGDEVIGDAPYSSSNSLSVNMDVLDRVTDTPS